MFTGLVEALGTVTLTRLDHDGVGRWMEIAAPFCQDLKLGESVSVNGTCLTVVTVLTGHFGVQVSPTTLSLTTMGGLRAGDQVNLERSLMPATRLGGHWVLGHVDTRGTVESIRSEGASRHVTVSYDRAFQRWVLPQGSVTLDGISLTVVDTSPGQLTVTVIPHTLMHTNMQQWNETSVINIEFDVLGKYVEHLLIPYSASQGGQTP